MARSLELLVFLLHGQIKFHSFQFGWTKKCWSKSSKHYKLCDRLPFVTSSGFVRLNIYTLKSRKNGVFSYKGRTSDFGVRLSCYWNGKICIWLIIDCPFDWMRLNFRLSTYETSADSFSYFFHHFFKHRRSNETKEDPHEKKDYTDD